MATQPRIVLSSTCGLEVFRMTKPNAAPLVQELTARSAGLSADLRFVKELQWRVIYHCILAYAALVGAFQIPTPIGPAFHAFCKAAAYVAIVLIGGAAILQQLANNTNMRLYRHSAEAVEGLLNDLTGLRDEAKCRGDAIHAAWLRKQRSRRRSFPKVRSWWNRIFTNRSRQETIYSLIFVGAFVSAILAAAFGAWVIIWFDK